uniref:Uncharacterized protein n=1 Tax=Arundo donax TaxID=35708 RepID=A0A0A8Z3L9_ARUDO
MAPFPYLSEPEPCPHRATSCYRPSSPSPTASAHPRAEEIPQTGSPWPGHPIPLRPTRPWFLLTPSPRGPKAQPWPPQVRRTRSIYSYLSLRPSPLC